MSSLIELEEPFKSLWRKGYFQEHPNGRKYICLYNNASDRTLISYARYLLSVKEGIILPDEVEADHRDNDKTNDSIDNLRIMSSENNKLKHYGEVANSKEEYHLKCENCGETFVFSEREIKHKERQNVEHVFCSRSCSTSFHKAIDEDAISRVRDLRSQGFTYYRIRKITGLAHATIKKYATE